MDRFFKQYIGDDAEFSIGDYMSKKQGDKDVNTTPWKPSEQDGKLVRKRVIRYTHPVNAPMAPPEAQARKEQTYQRFGEHGFTVETKTIVVGVPMTDCFFVKDRLIVAAAPTKGKVLLSLEFELEFVKSTMFRGIITKTTTSEMRNFSEHLRDYMSESLGEEVDAPKEEEKKTDKEVIVEEPAFPGALNLNVTHVLLGSVLLMQLWLMMEVRSLRHELHQRTY